MTSKPQKRNFHTPAHPSIRQDLKQTHFSSQRGGRTKRYYIGSLNWEIEPFLIFDMSQIKENWDRFQKILLDIEKNFFALYKMLNVTFNLKWYLLHPKCHFNPWWKRTNMVSSPQIHADQLHNQYRTNLVAEYAVPLTEPQWTYQACDASIWYLHHMTTCLLEGMLKIFIFFNKKMKILPFFFHGLLRQSKNTVI